MLSLYRKYRPKEFNEILGQDHIIRTLNNQIINKRIGHAYLFTGTRGTGKTTLGRIFANEVNSNSVTDEYSVIEIDAASHNGVDDIRNINEAIKYSPTSGEYKIYIIDEVHMLSTGAFNALLKTLEEPPNYIIFILCTTDPQKIPATILSRVQRFDLRRINKANLMSLVKDICKKENVSMDDRAIDYIATLGDGSARDTLSILENIITAYLGKELITYEDVLDQVGAVDKFVYTKLTQRVIEKDYLGCVEIISNVIDQGRNIRTFTSDYISFLRGLIFLTNNAGEYLDESTDIYEGLENIQQDMLILLIKEMVDLEVQLRYNPSPILLELKLALICNHQQNSNQQVEDYKEVQQPNLYQELKKEIESLKQQVNKLTNEGNINNANQIKDEKDIHQEIKEYWNSLVSKPDIKEIMERIKLNRKGDSMYSVIIPSYLIPYEHFINTKLSKFSERGIVFNIENK